VSLTSELQRAEARLNALINAKADQEEARARADAVAAAQERRDRVRRDADRCSAHQARYDGVFTKFGKRAPLALADSAPPDYRRKLYALAQTMLPSDHTLAGIDPEELDGTAIGPFEELLFKALDAEAEKPSEENLPETVADSRAKFETFDLDSGARKIEWRAKESFIKGLSMEPKRVAMLVTNRGNAVFRPRV
jgi:hypothetical protein